MRNRERYGFSRVLHLAAQAGVRHSLVDPNAYADANLTGFLGGIMAIGIAVANAILLVTFAEQSRRHGGSELPPAIHAARARMRPVLMTSAAMMKMPMNKRRSRWMIEIVRMDVREGRLIEAQQEGGCAQNCARNSHKY